MKRKLCILLICASCMSLVSCGTNVSSIEPLSLEEVAGTRLAQMTAEEKEGLIYKVVSDQITVDKEKLLGIDSKDMGVINELFSGINQTLRGEKNGLLSDEQVNYLLMEFTKTPYEWQQMKVNPVGFDPATRLYFVDVTYGTTSTLKSAVPSSKIPNGSDMEEVLKQKRYKDYTDYLTLKYNGSDKASKAYENFVKAWGTFAEIQKEQQGVSLLNRTRELGVSGGGIGRLTYAGLVDDTKLAVGATMTVRYVLSYNFNLGEETDLSVKSLYIKDYALNDVDKIVDSYKLSDSAGVEVLNPFVDQLILSYNKAVEESNNIGLYKLFDNYANVDKYYDDIQKYSYLSIGGYNYKILQKSGTNLVVKVDRILKIRAKGGNMSLPTYDESLIFNLVLSNDDTIKIKSVYPIKQTMIGEPMSVIKNVSGISDLIKYSGESFTNDNKKKVESVIKDFSNVILSASVDSEEFGKLTDLGTSQMTLRKIADNITSLNANKKTTYVISWDTKTNVYCSLRLREIFETDANNYDTESQIDLVNRNGEWKVVNYTRILNVKTSKTSIENKSALCVTEKSSDGVIKSEFVGGDEVQE